MQHTLAIVCCLLAAAATAHAVIPASQLHENLWARALTNSDTYMTLGLGQSECWANVVPGNPDAWRRVDDLLVCSFVFGFKVSVDGNIAVNGNVDIGALRKMIWSKINGVVTVRTPDVWIGFMPAEALADGESSRIAMRCALSF